MDFRIQKANREYELNPCQETLQVLFKEKLRSGLLWGELKNLAIDISDYEKNPTWFDLRPKSYSFKREIAFFKKAQAKKLKNYPLFYPEEYHFTLYRNLFSESYVKQYKNQLESRLKYMFPKISLE